MLESMAFWYIIYVCKKLSQVTIMDTPREGLGGGKVNAKPHKAEKIASVDDMGNILVGKLDRAGKKFVKQNIVQIADGIHKYYK